MKYKDYNDYELIYMVREQDEGSYGILFQKYLPIIKRIAYDYYNSYNTYGYDLDDFIQEGYLGFQKAILSYDENKDILFYTFVTLCIHRKIINFCKRISCDRKNISNVNYVDCDEVPLVDSSLGMDTLLSFQELFSDVWDVIYTFPIEYTSVFELRMNHFRYSEISQLLDVSTRKAEFMVRRIMNKIRKECSLTA